MPFDFETAKAIFKKGAKNVGIFKEVLLHMDWRSLLILIQTPMVQIDLIFYLVFNPSEAPFPNLLALFPRLKQFSWYAPVFWSLLGVISVIAVIMAARAISKAVEPSQLKPGAIKGLLPFGYEDAEVFSHLQRDRDLKECLQAIGDEQWRFGVLSGESGAGKTSFLQAGLWPELEKLGFRCVYIKFSDADPFESVKRACLKQLSFAGEAPDGADFQGLLRAATEQDQTPIVLFFDQFEQFFVHRKRKKDREPFTQALARWFAKTPSPPIKILICVRGDFFDRLNEMQKSMRYALGPAQSFRLERFDPDQATEIFHFLTESAGLEYDREFISEMTRRELADAADGLISPVDIQVLARMTEWGDRAFNRKTFQKLGGAQELPSLYLMTALGPLITRSSRRAAINVMSALIDLERDTRAAALTFEELRKRLGDDTAGARLKDVFECLLRSDLPLILPSPENPENEEEKFELAHESLIPYLRLMAGEQLREPKFAYMLLDTYANLWLGFGRSSRYLLSWSRLRLIKRHGLFDAPGEHPREKKRFLAASQRLFRLKVAAVGLVVLLLLSVRIHWSSNARQTQLIKTYLYRQAFRLDNAEAITDIAEALAYAGDSHSALRVLDQLGSDYSKVNGLKRLAQSYFRLGDKEKYSALLSDMTRMAERMNNDDKAYALEFIAESYIELGDKAQAESLLSEQIKAVEQSSRGQNSAFFTIPVVRSYVRLGDKEKARAMLDEAINMLEQSGADWTRAQVLRAIAEFHSEIGTTMKDDVLLKKAIKIAGQISDNRFKTDALSDFIHFCIRLGMAVKDSAILSEAIKAAEQIGDYSSKAKALEEIASSYSTLGDKAKARALWESEIRTAERISNGRSKDSVLEEIAISCARTGEAMKETSLLEKAVKIVERIRDSGGDLKFYALKEISLSYFRLGEMMKGSALLEKSIKILERNDADWLRGRDFREFVNSYASLRDKEKERAMLANVVRIAERIDGQNKDGVLSEIARAYAELGSEMRDGPLLKEAVRIADRISSDISKSYVLSEVARSYAELGKMMKDSAALEEAVRIAGRINGTQYKCDILRAIARSYFEIGETVKAVALLEEAIKIMDRPSDYYRDDKAHALSDLAESYARLGDNKKARALLEDAIEAARWIDGSEKADALGAIVRSYARVAESSNDPSLLYDATLELISQPQPDSDRDQELDAMLSSKLAIADVGGLQLLTRYYNGEVEKTQARARILMACSHPELIGKNMSAAPSRRARRFRP